MRTRIISALSLAGAYAIPFLANAQTAANPQDGLIGLIRFANTALNDVMILLITAAIVAFFWGMVKYIFSAAGGEDRAQGLQIIMYSVIAIFAMVSIWGIIHVLQNTFGVSNGSTNNQAEQPSQLPIQ